MPRKRLVELQFPLAGLDRRQAYQRQPPFSTPDCLNVRPSSTLQRRLRGGSRPGLDKAFNDIIGSGSAQNEKQQIEVQGDGQAENNIQLLTVVDFLALTGQWQIDFNGSGLGDFIAVTATAADVQAVLSSYSQIGAGNVSVTGPDGGPWTVEFIGALAGTHFPLMVTQADWSPGYVEVRQLVHGRDGSQPRRARDEIQELSLRRGAGAVINETQQIKIEATPAGSLPTTGTWTLSFNGSTWAHPTTPYMAIGVPASTVQAALESLNGIEPGDVVVSKDNTYQYTVIFQGNLAGKPLPLIECTHSGTFDQGLVRSYRVTAGNGHLPDDDRNAVWNIYLARASAGVSAGDWYISWAGQWNSTALHETSTIADVQAAFDYFTNPAISVEVTRAYPSPWRIKFVATGPADINLFNVVSTNPNEAIYQLIEVEGGTSAPSWGVGYSGSAPEGELHPYNATAAEVQTAIEGISVFDPGDVAVTGSDGGPFRVTFQGQFVAFDMQLLEPASPLFSEGSIAAVEILQGASEGTWEVQFNGAGPTADKLSIDATAAEVKNALVSLNTIALDDVVVSGVDGGPWDVEFVGNLGGQNLPLILTTDTFTGGNMYVTVIQDGQTIAGTTGAPVRLLNKVDVLRGDGRTFWEDRFEDESLGATWNAYKTVPLPALKSDRFASTTFTAGSSLVMAIRDGIANVADPATTLLKHAVSIFLAPWAGEYLGTYFIYGGMNAAQPDPFEDGFVAGLSLTGSTGAFGGSIQFYSGGSLVQTDVFDASNSPLGYPAAGWFTVTVLPGPKIRCTWRDNLLVDVPAIPMPYPTSPLVTGFGLEANMTGDICVTDAFRVQYHDTVNNERLQRLLVAVAGGNLYREGFLGELKIVPNSDRFANERYLQSAERTQNLYIADHGDVRVDGNGGTVQGGNQLSHPGSVSDWTALGIDTNTDVCVLSNSRDGTTDGTYKILSVLTNRIHLSPNAQDGRADYRIERAPKVYDGKTNKIDLLFATAGQVPTGCPHVAVYRDRLVLAGAPSAPHVWYMSRQGNPLDWDYFSDPDDPGRAVAGLTAKAGMLGEPITAVIAHTDDYMVFGTSNTLWLLRGDPAAGGIFDNLSFSIGIIAPHAWCRAPTGELAFLSRDGLYFLPSGAAGFPASASRERLPQELRNVNTETHTVLLEYDVLDRGIHIFLTSADLKQSTHWWFDWETKGFWQSSYDVNHEPLSTLYYDSIETGEHAVLMGGRDGYVRRHGDLFEGDDGVPFKSRVLYGPLLLSGNGYDEGRVKEIVGTTAGAPGGAIAWEAMVADSHEEAVSASAFATGTWKSNGVSLKERPRGRGRSFAFRLSNGETYRMWAIDRITAVFEAAGKQRQ